MREKQVKVQRNMLNKEVYNMFFRKSVTEKNQQVPRILWIYLWDRDKSKNDDL